MRVVPYGDEQCWKNAILVGSSISANAAFMVAYELLVTGSSAGVGQAELEAILDFWAANFDHPLKVPFLNLIRGILQGRSPDASVVRGLFEDLKKYPGQYNAVNILCSVTEDQTAEALYDEVLASWR